MNINKIYIDFDGVLTNGKLTITSDGSQLFKEVHSRDIRAIRELIARGYEVTIISASSSPIIRAYANKVGAKLIVRRDKQNIDLLACEDFIFIGDDAWDIPLLKKAKQAYCPADAYYRVMQIPGIQILKAKGGEGVIAELLDILTAKE